MENNINVPVENAPEDLKLVVFQKPTRSDAIVAAVAGAATTAVLGAAITIGSALIQHGLETRKAKKLAAQEAKLAQEADATPEDPEETED